MSVICLIGNKHGAGKSMLAVNLASALARSAPTILFDADPRHATLNWCLSRQLDTRLQVVDAAVDLQSEWQRSIQRYQHTVIDCPVSVRSLQTLAALNISDIALIPVQPMSLDLWATVKVDYALQDARRMNPTLRGLLVLNQMAPRQRMSSLTKSSLSEIDLSATDTLIRHRPVFNHSLQQGRSVLEMGSTGRTASAEIQQLINEVLPDEKFHYQ